MKQKEAYYKMLRLINTDGWDSKKEIYEEVQRLARVANGGVERAYGRIIVVYQNNELLTQGTSWTLSKVLEMNASTIRKRAEKNFIDKEGRQFKFLEEKE
ncbi:hypothetical protein OU491_001514 [Enterococcus hirae]|nr:hypothetical protein [Enterococcus hirae]